MALNQVFVTNLNTQAHIDRYDGEDYVFTPNEPVAVPVAAAQHMLGYNLVDKTDTLSRLGKAFKYDPVAKQFGDDLDGVRWLANFVFEEATMVPKSALAQAIAAQDEQLAIA